MERGLEERPSLMPRYTPRQLAAARVAALAPWSG